MVPVMTTIAEPAASLTEWLETTKIQMSRMLKLLKDEVGLLSTRDATGIERVAEAKRILTPTLDELAEQRRLLLGETVGEEALACFLADQAIDPTERSRLLGEWREVERLVRDCRRQNDINGTYIGLLRRHVETSLDILGDSGRLDATYGPDGTKHRPGRPRHSYSV